jgi:PleD family two-component response regulator
MSPSRTAPAICWRKSASFSNNPCEAAGVVREPPRILIVDDNEHNRAIIAARLSAKGYSIAEACDGLEALEAARVKRPISSCST